jgi:predicted nucleotidyltransferase
LTENATEYYCRRVVANVLDVWRLKALREKARRELEGVADWYWEKRVYAKVLEGWVECE